MNVQGCRQRKDISFVQGDSGRGKGVRDSNFPSKTIIGANRSRRTTNISHLKHLQTVHPKETCEETYFSAHGDKKRDLGSVTRFPHPEHFGEAAPRIFPETKVYQSFMQEEQRGDEGRSKDSSVPPKQTTTENATKRKTKGKTETLHTSRITQPTHAVRRYALFRAMLCQSRFEEDHAFKKDRNRNEGKMSHSRAQRPPNIAWSDKVQPGEKNHKHQENKFLFWKEKPVHETPEITDVSTENDDNNNLCGTQFPKRIYIRELSSVGAIVDEIVDVKNERDWEVLNYMSPLRHISCKPHERPKRLCFRDLKDFDIYYYPHPWR